MQDPLPAKSGASADEASGLAVHEITMAMASQIFRNGSFLIAHAKQKGRRRLMSSRAGAP